MVIFREVLFRQPILIYQLPKIGSQTIEATLRCSAPAVPVFRFHFLSRAIAATLRRGLREGQGDPRWRQDVQAQLQMMLRVSLALRARKLLSLVGVRLPKLQVITGVREPIGLALSSMFENYYRIFPTGPQALRACREALFNPNTLKYIQEWFDLEIKPMLGFNIYQLPFNCQRGYAIYENRLARLLVFRFEALDQLPTMLKEFLGFEVSQVENRNVGRAKDYAEPYQYVQENFRLPPEITTLRCHSPLMCHFYSVAEREQFYLRWTEPAERSPAAMAQVA